MIPCDLRQASGALGLSVCARISGNFSFGIGTMSAFLLRRFLYISKFGFNSSRVPVAYTRVSNGSFRSSTVRGFNVIVSLPFTRFTTIRSDNNSLKYTLSYPHAEMDFHLNNTDEGRVADNSRNGYGKKTLKSNLGHLELSTPRDRHSTFEPQIIPKRSTKKLQSLKRLSFLCTLKA